MSSPVEGWIWSIYKNTFTYQIPLTHWLITTFENYKPYELKIWNRSSSSAQSVQKKGLKKLKTLRA